MGHDAWRVLGAHPATVDGESGYVFRLWAPRATLVEWIGDFNGWNAWPMARRKDDKSVWQLFVTGIGPGDNYKFRVHGADGSVVDKADPFAFAAELRPNTASTTTKSTHRWRDSAWMNARSQRLPWHEPISIYELHLGSWVRHGDGSFYGYREVADRLVDHVVGLGFTHVEFMPLSEFPYDPSWGYLATGYFAPTSRYGSPDDLRYLVDRLHRAGLGVIIDFVPAHFPKDEHALARFDGEPLFEYPDPRRGEHPDWGSLIFDYARPEVRSFLLASAAFWIESLHIDGLRVDAVASMVYLNYSRVDGEWEPNDFGGHQHLEAISFLQDLNRMVRARFPGVITLAEESTAFPRVSGDPPAPYAPWDAGLGFHFKWNMGWMHDTLGYLGRDPIHRRYHHNDMTFPSTYQHAEDFVLPLSHDEMVHGKGSLVRKMGGDWADGLRQLRLLLAWQWTTPGKKLLFSGGEFGQESEWDFDGELDWGQAAEPARRGVLAFVAALNRLYRERSALHRLDCDPRGFAWIDADDADRSVYSYKRLNGDGDLVIAVFNMTPVSHPEYRLTVPSAGAWRVLLDSSSAWFADADRPVGEPGPPMAAVKVGTDWTVRLSLPPLGALLIARS